MSVLIKDLRARTYRRINNWNAKTLITERNKIVLKTCTRKECKSCIV